MVYFAETAWERVEKVWVLPRRRVRWLKTEPNFAFARMLFSNAAAHMISMKRTTRMRVNFHPVFP